MTSEHMLEEAFESLIEELYHQVADIRGCELDDINELDKLQIHRIIQRAEQLDKLARYYENNCLGNKDNEGQ